MAETKKIVLASSDGEKFIIEEAVANQSKLLANMIEEGCTEGEIPIANVAGKHLAKVFEYAKKHAKSDHEDDQGKRKDGDDEELKAWDNEFAKSMDQPMLYHVILASNYLNMQHLLGLMCQTVADMIKGKKPEEIRQIFNIKNDFTPEEEEEIRRENQWAFDS